MKIGFLFNRDVPNAFYRVHGPATAVRHLGHEVTLVEQGSDYRFDLSSLLRCDAVHVYRRGDPLVMAGVDRLRERGVAVIWDNDDDIRLRPEGTRIATRISHRRAHEDFRLQRKMILRADVVTTTSSYLARLYRTISTGPVLQVENYLLPEQCLNAPPERSGLVIGWVAAGEHSADARNLQMSRTLTEVLGRHPQVRVSSIGVQLDIDSARYAHRPWVPLRDLQGHASRFDIALAPLSDIPMSYARSNVKVKEYAGAGVPWLASMRGPYSGLGPDQGGMLVRDEDWGRALSVLIESSDLRATLRERASAWARTQTVHRHADQWVHVFEQAISIARTRPTGGPAGSRRAAGAGA